MTSDATLWLIDSSALIGIKTTVPGSQQWRLFRTLEDLVIDGQLAFPKRVKDEVTGMAHPDAPGVWADGVFSSIGHLTEPSPTYIRQVMSCDAAKVVDPNKPTEDADPYLIALALELGQQQSVVVVTNDTKDNPIRIAVSTACNIMQVSWCPLTGFLTEIGFGD
jgi:rRNA maturation endonuclease Nob1